MAPFSREQVRPASCLPVPRPLRLGACSHIAELVRAGDALLGHQALEHQLARRDHRGRILLRRQPDLVYDIEQAGHYARSEEHTSELQSLAYLVCRLLLEKKKTNS